MADANAKPFLFISHKHENHRIADAIRKFVDVSTGGLVEVYQSSSDQTPGPRAGFSLNQELKNALCHAGAFVLIYTHSTLDWSYCMFEYGVANNPQSPDTRMILFRCCDAVPLLFAGQVNVNARELVDIQKFTNQLLTAPDFFRDYGGPVTRHQPNSQGVATAAGGKTLGIIEYFETASAQELAAWVAGAVAFATSALTWIATGFLQKKRQAHEKNMEPFKTQLAALHEIHKTELMGKLRDEQA
jgi:hypothetical protein